MRNDKDARYSHQLTRMLIQKLSPCSLPCKAVISDYSWVESATHVNLHPNSRTHTCYCRGTYLPDRIELQITHTTLLTRVKYHSSTELAQRSVPHIQYVPTYLSLCLLCCSVFASYLLVYKMGVVIIYLLLHTYDVT